jgi:hypothetical protein
MALVAGVPSISGAVLPTLILKPPHLVSARPSEAKILMYW